MNQKAKVQQKLQFTTSQIISKAIIVQFAHFYQLYQFNQRWKLTTNDLKTNKKQGDQYYKDKNWKQTNSFYKQKYAQDLESLNQQQKVTKSIRPKMEYVTKSKDFQLQQQSKIIKVNSQKKAFDFTEENQIKSNKSRKKEALSNQPSQNQIKLQIESIKKMPKSVTEYAMQQKKSLSRLPRPTIKQKLLQQQSQNKQLKQSVLNEFKHQNLTRMFNLNQFFIQPNQEQTHFNSPISFESKIYQINKSQKVQNSKILSIQSNKNSEKFKQVEKQKEKNNQMLSSRLIGRLQNPDDKITIRKQTKSPNKIIKQSVLQIKKQHFHPPSKDFIVERQIFPDRQFLIQPSTHKTFSQNIFPYKKVHQEQPEIGIPVQDYDEDLDQERLEYNSKQFSEFYDPNRNLLDNRDTIVVSKGIVPNIATKQKTASQQFRVLDNFGIDINYIKKIENSQKKIKVNEEQKSNTLIKLPQKSNQSQQNQLNDNLLSHTQIEMIHKQQKQKGQTKTSVKPNRKRIFQHSSLLSQQLSHQDLSEQEISMLLNAKGNKYKQVIVLQYINTCKTKQND